MLGHSKMNNRDQIEDGLQRGWIVLAIEHRLCPGVNVLEGPMTDVRDAFNWAQSGGLEKAIEEGGSHLRPDPERVMAMGTSAGGHLALSLVSVFFSQVGQCGTFSNGVTGTVYLFVARRVNAAR